MEEEKKIQNIGGVPPKIGVAGIIAIAVIIVVLSATGVIGLRIPGVSPASEVREATREPPVLPEFTPLSESTPSPIAKYAPSLPKTGLSISSVGPADILLVDPQGKRIGFDFNSGKDIYEIPGAYSGPEHSEIKIIFLEPQFLDYKLFVKARADGTMHVGMTYASDKCSADKDVELKMLLGQLKKYLIELNATCKGDLIFREVTP